MSRKKKRKSTEEFELNIARKLDSAESDILIERDGTITFVSFFADLLPVAIALDPAIGKMFQITRKG